MRVSFTSTITALVAMAIVFPLASIATPLIMPFATKSSTRFEGGYTLDLRVCNETLCELTVGTPQGTILVAESTIAIAKGPSIQEAKLFIDPANGPELLIVVEIELGDVDRQYRPKVAVARFEFLHMKLVKSGIELRAVAD